MEPTFDLLYQTHGSSMTITPVSPAGKEWLFDNVVDDGWRQIGQVEFVDLRLGADILEAAVIAGRLTIAYHGVQ